MRVVVVQRDPIGGFRNFVDKTVEMVSAAYSDLKSRENLENQQINTYDFSTTEIKWISLTASKAGMSAME